VNESEYLRRATIMAGPFKDYGGYKQANGIVGKTVEAVGWTRTVEGPRTLIFFTDGTYLECETWGS
jgi:hypothetical protein